MEVNFGDGTDTDTLDMVFGRLDGYNVGITHADGSEKDYRFGGVDVAAEEWSFFLTPIDDDGEIVGEPTSVPYDDITALVIY